jgi:hypothetical protein
MRKDMSRVIIDTYRSGGAGARAIGGTRRKYRNRLDCDGEGGAPRLGMRRDILSNAYRKEFGDNISPLSRYLRKQVFRPWDEVQQEIFAQIDLRSTIHWHLSLHLQMLVETDTTLLDGEVVLAAAMRHRPISYSHCVVFVHPVTRLLLPIVKSQCWA